MSAGQEEPAGTAGHHLEIARTARYWTLGDPEAANQEVWVVLHGYGQLARRFLRRFTELDRPGRLVVAPEALSRFYIGSGEGRHGRDALVGATWMTREDRDNEIRDYVAYLDRLAATVVGDGARLTVLGFSQGVATAWRWITYGCAPGLARFIAWAGELPPDLDMERAGRALQGVEVLMVGGEHDHTVPPKLGATATERLERVGVPFRVVRHPGGHDIHAETLLEIAAG